VINFRLHVLEGPVGAHVVQRPAKIRPEAFRQTHIANLIQLLRKKSFPLRNGLRSGYLSLK